jgi:hypothetical protein
MAVGKTIVCDRRRIDTDLQPGWVGNQRITGGR